MTELKPGLYQGRSDDYNKPDEWSRNIFGYTKGFRTQGWLEDMFSGNPCGTFKGILKVSDYLIKNNLRFKIPGEFLE